MKVSVIIPVYNEEHTIAPIIDIVQQVKLINGWKKELIVIDDCSTDSTYKTLLKKAPKYDNLKLIKHDENKGKGAAVRTGIKASTGNIIIIQDADLEYDPNDYNALIRPIIAKEAQVVYGSRRINKTNKQSSSFSFLMGGIGITWLFNMLYLRRLTDEPTCYKTFSSDVIKNIDFKGDGFEWEPEVTAKIAKKGIHIIEVPIKYFPRSVKEGKKIKWQDGFKAMWTLLKYRFVN